MTSQRQIRANQQNARKSTGPKTPEGKAVVVLIDGEIEKDLISFGQRLRAQLAPVGELELLLAGRIVSSAWRLRRAIAVESALFEEGDAPVNAFIHFGREKKMTAHSRYETSIERGLYKALHELQRLQAARDGGFVPAPVAADVEVSVAGVG